MFFNIGRSRNNKFPIHVIHKGLYIDLDVGWKISDKKLVKGLENNQCTIYLTDYGIEMDTNPRRTFPLYFDNNNISNLIEYENKHISNIDTWYLDKSVKILKTNHSIEFKSLNFSDQETFDYLYEYLDSKIKNFETDLPIKFFPTGGVDIAILISFVLKHKKRFELLTSEHKDMDYFVCHNRALIGNNWAYRDIHHWRDTSILLSGTHGDEMMLRFPPDAYLLGKLNGENILDTLRNNSSLYHSHYYLRSKHQKQYDEIDKLNFNETESKNYILSRNAVDYQHWHLGNTLTWTPFNDLEITNIMLNFSYDFLRSQLLDAEISKKIIERNDPKYLNLISKNKNINHFGHLHKIFEGVEILE
jgi:hypothetical protein